MYTSKVKPIKFYYDKNKTAELEQKLQTYFLDNQEERGDQLHVYDLIYCPVKAYNRLTGVPKKITKKDIGVLLFGAVSGKLVAELFPEDQREYETALKNIIGHIDIYENHDIILEVKSTRRRMFKRNQIPLFWINQLKIYMALENKNVGYLVILSIFSSQILCFHLELTDEELADKRLDCLLSAQKIREAVKTHNPNMLEPIYEQCRWCWYKKCVRRKKGKEDV